MCKKLIFLISFIFVLTTAAQADLVGWWRFDETSGTIAHDGSGNGYDGTLVGGPTWTAGRIGGALDFDGSDDLVELGAIDVQGQGITLAGWIKPRSFAINDGRVVTKANEWGENDHWWMLSTIGSGGEIRLRFRLKTEGESTTTLIAGSGPLVTDEWQHATATWDGSTMRLYLNGEEVGSGDKGGAGVATDPAVSAAIGSQPSDAFAPATPDHVAKYFDGLIDDVRLYDAALDQQAIQLLMESGGGYPFAFGPDPEDGAIHTATWVTLSWSSGDFAVSHDVYFGDNFDDVTNGADDAFRGNQVATTYIAGFPGFAFSEGLVPGTTYYWRIDEVNDADPNSPWKGSVWSFSIPPKTAYNPDPSDGAGFVDPNAIFTWTGGYGAKLHTFYIGDNYDEVNTATGGAPSGTASFDPGPLESEKVYYWRVDEFDGIETHKGGVWAFTTPGAVGNPQPANGAADVQINTVLSWTAADNAASHELYFGADKDVVKNATTASPQYIGPRAVGAESYDPGGLAWNAAYCWRVDEVYPDETVKGVVWSFTTAAFVLVDDFESYNDIDPPDPASNRIFDKWVDGFGTTDNGALVGNDFPPYTEQTIVHGGAQSMPYAYDNNLKTSEATLTLVWPRDWTKQGVARL
ncbi:MAG: LamG-like jellyroll fold domain-containing protein, partial [Planctomycetota bacterium]